jgi:hypothetical protein
LLFGVITWLDENMDNTVTVISPENITASKDPANTLAASRRYGTVASPMFWN